MGAEPPHVDSKLVVCLRVSECPRTEAHCLPFSPTLAEPVLEPCQRPDRRH